MSPILRVVHGDRVKSYEAGTRREPECGHKIERRGRDPLIEGGDIESESRCEPY